MKYNAIDLFSGCGGLTEGLKSSGFNVIAAVEIDRKACETYSMNHPGVRLIAGDIREVSAEYLLKETGLRPGELDLLAGCPPCQGFSTLRSRNGNSSTNDARNDLVDDFARLAIGLRPKMVMMENVAALESYDKFQNFLQLLESEGYAVIFEVVNVADFGVPQRRKRLILSASRVGRPVIAERSSHGVTVRDAIGAMLPVGQSGDDIHDLTAGPRTPRVQRIIEAIPKNGGSRHSLPEHLKLSCHLKTSGFNDVYGRMRWDEVAPTITSGCHNPSKGRFLHPVENRPISIREAALLQGFPFSYRFDIKHGKESLALMIGNALPPPFIAAHGKAIAKELRTWA